MENMIYYTLAAFVWTFVAVFVSIVWTLSEDKEDD
jgi:hypothetical protein